MNERNSIGAGGHNELVGQIAYPDDIGASAYGFIDLPSLFVFFDPFSPFSEVRQFLLSGDASWQRAQKLASRLNQTARDDLILRMSVVGHEIQHFWDILATPFGCTLLKEHLKLGGRALGLLADITRGRTDSNNSVLIPIAPDKLKDPSVGQKLLAQAAKCSLLKDSARWTLETSAVLTQRIVALDVFGDLERLDKALEHAPAEYQVNFVLDQLAGLSDPKNIFITVRKLIYLALCSSTPDRLFGHSLRALRASLDSAFAARVNVSSDLFAAFLSKWEQTVRVSDKNDREENTAFLNQLTARDNAILDWMAKIFNDFTIHAYPARDAWINSPMTAFDPYSPNQHLPLPRVYYYPSNPEFAIFTRAPDFDPDDLAELQCYDNGVVVARVLPGSPSFYDKRPNLQSRTWVDIAKDLSGAICLTRSLKWRHPLYGYWMRSTSEQFDLSFQA